MTYNELVGDKAFAAAQYEREREYWIDKLSGELQKTGFPPDIKTAVEEPGKRTGAVTFKFPAPLFERLMEIINDSDSRLHMVLVTGLTLLLHKYTGHNDIVIGTPIDKQEMEGEFINTILPLRNRIEERTTVKELLMQVRQTVIEASKNQNYPIETIPYELDMSVADGEFPLFDTAALLRNIQDEAYIRHMKLNIIFSFLRTGEYLEVVVRYNASLYNKETIERIIRHFTHLLQEAFNNVDAKPAEISLLTGDEKQQLLVEFNDTGADYPQDKMIHQLFEEQVERNPADIAVESKGKVLTYEALNRRSTQLSRRLRAVGINTDSVAAVILDSSIEVLVAVLAVLKAGGTYLPMGFEYPGDRVNYLLEDSEAKAVLTRKSLVEGMTLRCPVTDMEDEDIYSGNSENLEPVNCVDNLAYIIYTSGTTGQPKGVMVEHRGLVNYIWWAARTYVRGEKMDFPLYTSISFDLTVTSIFTPLVTGNTVIVYGGVDKKFYIEDVIDDNRVGVVKLTPSHLKLIRQRNVNNSSIRRLIVGGEELETSLAWDIYNIFNKDIEIYNEYGPTETVVGSMIYKFDPGVDNRHSVPIGVPIANTQIYLLDRYRQPVPVGVDGEIYISGHGVARGYLRNPGLTGEKFVPGLSGEKEIMYRTGDLAVRLPDGNIEYKGRIDHQVKIRGYRVETGEIESRIVDFQKAAKTRREQNENIVEKLDLKSITRCKRCLIPVNYPGGIHFDDDGVCDICREYENYKDKALSYFKSIPDFHRVVKEAQKAKKSKYDCLMLYSGGKDSSYVLHRLVEMGLNVLAFTFDNGYISDTAFENIERTTALLNVEHLVLDSEAMKEIFVESLWSDYNVCNGCFKAVNTFGAKLAHEHNINLVISGLTRGQIFDIKLHGLFKLGSFDEETIEERLKLFRRNYHSMIHRTSRLIGVEISDEMLGGVQFVDYFRYDDISTREIFDYLKQQDDGWIRPTDTGASSSNCIINDVGIYVHLKDKGCHFYGPQLSWDCRFGTITREEGLEEITGFKVDYQRIHRVLDGIGYYDAFTGVVVTDIMDEKGEKALCAYIVADKDFDFAELRSYLSGELPDYMIPTYFTRIDMIPLTPGGKIDRKALPEPRLSVDGEYAAPRNAVEEKMVELWAEVLGLQKGNIGIDANFFEVGGHSLRATFLAAALHKEFNVKVPLVKIFETPTIRGMAEYINEAAEETFFDIPAVEKREYYPLSSAQRRLYFVQQMQPETVVYNITLVTELEEVENTRLSEAFMKLIKRHESLRTSFHVTGDEPVQRVHDKVDFEIEYINPDDGKQTPMNLIAAKEIVKRFIRPFNLSGAPLLRAGLLKNDRNRHFLVVDMHHIISDVISQQVLIDDYISLYEEGKLPSLRIQYKDYSVWENSPQQQASFDKQKGYWIDLLGGELPVLNLPTDYPRPPVRSYEGSSIAFTLGKEKNEALKKLAFDEGVTLFALFLSVYYIFLSRITGQEEIIVGTPIAGRRHTDLEKVIGMFVNMLALRNHPKREIRFTDFLSDVKDMTLRAFENQDYPYDELVAEVAVKNENNRNPLFDAAFGFHTIDPKQETGDGEDEVVDRKPGGGIFEHRVSRFDLSLYGVDRGNTLLFSFEYCTKLFRREKIERFTGYFKEILAHILDVKTLKLEDIEISHELLSTRKDFLLQEENYAEF